ncbi:thioredoxin family protein [Blastopirellula sp. J2-11]|uniref:thioredoxin family protein n=1 Tax=Blastopirellula sp. J2-11 TaxID=2943192 RepID=UPI0021C619AA|nr:thioredoxin family protein [Blastopirellula sp. J2-11]UUO04639.1 thioredoxin family protein [Blastopirellula sp. J2-11]
MKSDLIRRRLLSGQSLTYLVLLLLVPALAGAQQPSRADAAVCLAYAAVVREMPVLVTPNKPAPLESEPADYREAYALYKRDQRPMVVMVTASWCPYCPAMKNELLQMKRAGKLSGVSLVILDHDQDRATARNVMGTRRTLPALSVYHYVGGKAKESRPQAAREIGEILLSLPTAKGSVQLSPAGAS